MNINFCGACGIPWAVPKRIHGREVAAPWAVHPYASGARGWGLAWKCRYSLKRSALSMQSSGVHRVVSENRIAWAIAAISASNLPCVFADHSAVMPADLMVLAQNSVSCLTRASSAAGLW